MESLRKIALFKIHVSFVGNELSGVSQQASYAFQHFHELSSLDTYVQQRLHAFHLRGCLSLLATTRHIISNRATLGRCPFFRAHHLNTNTVFFHAMHSHLFHAMSLCICNAGCHCLFFHVTCMIRGTCNIYDLWIIIYTTYNSHP